jgi:hypothetical protein
MPSRPARQRLPVGAATQVQSIVQNKWVVDPDEKTVSAFLIGA